MLIDDKVASSGESLVGYLNTLENVVLVGTNTSGVFLSSANNKSQLPNSHINISYGNIIEFNKGCAEGKGFEPDVWVSNGDSLDKVLKLISRDPQK